MLDPTPLRNGPSDPSTVQAPFGANQTTAAPRVTRAIHITADGNISYTTHSKGLTVTSMRVFAGTILPIRLSSLTSSDGAEGWFLC